MSLPHTPVPYLGSFPCHPGLICNSFWPRPVVGGTWNPDVIPKYQGSLHKATKGLLLFIY